MALAEIQRQIGEWECCIVKKLFWYAWIGNCWHGEGGGRLTRSTLSHMLNLESVFGFLWLVWVGNQGKNRQVGSHWLSPDSLGPIAAEVVDESSVLINGMAVACLSIPSLNMKIRIWKPQKVRWFKSAEKATYTWKADCYFKHVMPEDDFIHGSRRCIFTSLWEALLLFRSRASISKVLLLMLSPDILPAH